MLKLILLSACVAVAVQAVRFRIKNNDGGDIWIGIQGNPGKQHLRNGGFVLGKGQEVAVDAPDDWAGRFWSRTWCDPNTKHCLTGDCGNKVECNGAGGNPPVTLVEITLKGYGGIDYYDLSLVDGFNTPATIEPISGQGDGGQNSCKKAKCLSRINNECPGELQLKTGNGVLGCKSACLAFNTDQYCCRGNYNRSETCKSKDWPKDYPKFFKDRCSDAYSYAYDDKKSTFTCKANEYLITFGG